MSEVEDEDSAFRPSRRALIKGAAVVGAGVWAAPAVTTLGARAFAAGSNTPCTTGYVCGSGIPYCNAAQTCMCITTNQGATVCSDLFATCGAACNTDSDCPSGSVCQAPGSGCCGQVCIALCPAGAAAADTRGPTPNAG